MGKEQQEIHKQKNRRSQSFLTSAELNEVSSS